MSARRIVTSSEAETRRVARDLASRLRPGDLVALEGPLGAGKTCFVRGLAEGLGLDASEVASPTFLVCHEHEPAEGGAGSRLVHVDAYRLGGPEELETIGWDGFRDDAGTIVAVEWADRLAGSLPAERVTVRLAHVDAETRAITIHVPGDRDEGPDPRAAAAPGAGEDAGPARAAAGPRCRICGAPVDADAETWPFCSSRCRLVDLGEWLGGRYCIERAMSAEDFEDV